MQRGGRCFQQSASFLCLRVILFRKRFGARMEQAAVALADSGLKFILTAYPGHNAQSRFHLNRLTLKTAVQSRLILKRPSPSPVPLFNHKSVTERFRH